MSSSLPTETAPGRAWSLRSQWLILTGLVALTVAFLAIEDATVALRISELSDEFERIGPDIPHFVSAWLPWWAASPLVAWIGLVCVPGRVRWWTALVVHALFVCVCGWLMFEAEFWLHGLVCDGHVEGAVPPPEVAAAMANDGWVVVEGFDWWFLLGYVWRCGTLSVVAVIASLSMMNADRERLRDQLSRELAETENRLLRAQLQPHFLFNALNGIQVLIDEDPERAKVVLRRLSQLLRNTLEDAHQTILPLARELEILADYIEIERLRFGDRVSIRVDVEPGHDDVLVPSFSLQPLIENCLIHGPGARPEGGTVAVTIAQSGDALEIVVTDDGPGRTASVVRQGGGHGLGILRRRLAREFEERASLDVRTAPEDGFEVTVRVPCAAS